MGACVLFVSGLNFDEFTISAGYVCKNYIKTLETTESMNEYIQMLELELKSRGFSGKTVKSYVFHVSCFLNHAGTESSKEDIQRYFVGLSERLDRRTVNLRISAVKFFYRQVLLKDFDIKYMKRPKRIPGVLTKEETVAILNQITNPKHTLLIETIYGCGLRVSEAVC
ncbi:MAG: hypothetical protein DRN71_03650 [Candidatus Nanohalarchaeota archaeon]|nr:MAG: hypothetical protein DRN71_03650 [Candidatus Nanohaloarchaeota archaeon]